MYKTGDLLKNIEKLKIELKQIKYPEQIDVDPITEGNPLVFLPILHFTLLSYSKYIAQFLLENQFELFSKSDKEFINKIFKAMIDLFNYKPSINPRQFFMSGYAEAKVIFCLEVIRLVKQEHNNLVKKVYSVSVKNVNASNMNKHRNKNNDSFRSNKSNNEKEKERDQSVDKEEFVNYTIDTSKGPSANKNKIRVINHQRGKIEHNDDIDSPKFNDDDKIDYQRNQKYNFNEEFSGAAKIKNEKINKNYNYNLEDEILDSDEEIVISNNINEKDNFYQNKKTENNSSNSNKYKNEKFLNEHSNSMSNYNNISNHSNNKNNSFNGNNSSSSTNKQLNSNTPQRNNNNSNNNSDFSSVVEIINSLAISIKEMTNRIDNFKNSIEERVTKIEAEVSLVKNKVSMLESNLINKNNLNTNHAYNKDNNIAHTNNMSESNSNLSENNDHIFSFADDHHNPNHNSNSIGSMTYSLISNKHEIYNNNPTSSLNQNTLNTNTLTNNSHYGKDKNAISNNNNNNNFINKIPSKILNDIENTDSIIQRVANRFKETQKLLNEFK